MTRSIAQMAGILTILFATAAVGAETKKENQARLQFQQGVELYQAGKFEQAAITFEQAYALKPTFKILYNIGQAENELGHYAAAYNAYQRYLSEGGVKVSKDRRTEVEVEIARLSSLIGTIEIRSKVAGATVFIDKKRHGETPLAKALLVDLGVHEVVIEADGKRLHDEVVRVAGGAAIIVDTETVAAAPPAGVNPTASAPPEQRTKRRVWTWVAAGVAGAFGIAAGVTGGLATSKAQELEQACSDQNCPRSRWNDLDETRTLATTTDVLIIGAGIAVTTAIVLFIAEPRIGSGESSPLISVSPSVGPAFAGVVVGRRF